MCGSTIGNIAEMQAAGESLLALGCRAALVKGGHLPGETVSDVLVTVSGNVRVWESSRIATRHTHGTGCTLASAIAASLAQGFGIESAVDRARTYVQRAIARAPGLGRGHGPLDHAHPLVERARAMPERVTPAAIGVISAYGERRCSMAKNYRIAVIAGDGIGREVVPEGIACVEAAARRLRLRVRVARFRLELRALRQDRPDDAGGRARRSCGPSTRSFSARSAIPACPITSRCGAC